MLLYILFCAISTIISDIFGIILISYKGEFFKESREFYVPRFLSITLQYTTATNVLTAVAAIPAPTIPAGFTLPYWLRYGCVKLRLKIPYPFQICFNCDTSFTF